MAASLKLGMARPRPPPPTITPQALSTPELSIPAVLLESRGVALSTSWAWTPRPSHPSPAALGLRPASPTAGSASLPHPGGTPSCDDWLDTCSVSWDLGEPHSHCLGTTLAMCFDQNKNETLGPFPLPGLFHLICGDLFIDMNE